MFVTAISLFNPISFGSKSKGHPDIKALWDKGLLPEVKKGFYGDTLTRNNVTREHLLPKSKGGTYNISNIVLASAENNRLRSNYDIRDFADPSTVKEYLKQFKDISIKGFNGKKYIYGIVDTLKKLGFKFE